MKKRVNWKKLAIERGLLLDSAMDQLDKIGELVGRVLGCSIDEDVQRVVNERDRLRADLTRAETLLDMAVTTISMREKKGG